MRELYDSGVEWIKQIPVSWGLQKLKYLTTKCERGTAPDYTDDVAIMVVNQATFSKGFFDTSNIRYSTKPAATSRGLLKKGDVLLASTGGGVLGKTYYFDEKETYVADGHVTVIRTKPELYAKYLYYFFFVNFDTFNSQMAEGSTNQTELQRDLLGEMLIPLPPSAEQIQIMKLLDRMCSKIDSIEAEVQSQIDVLEQYKRTVITEAVTKGLIPKGEMQESGIQWIGTMPAHWECIRGKYILKNVQKPVREDDGVITCFRDGEVTLRSNRREDGFTMADKEIGYQGIDVGDLVVHGMDGFAGAIGISDSRGKGSPVLNVLETAQNKRYIMYFLRSMAYSDVFLALATGIRVRSCDLRWNKLSELFYPIPPLEEQEAIVAHIDDVIEKTNAVIADKKAQLETLEEYKKSLIFEYVTGKKEVPIA